MAEQGDRAFRPDNGAARCLVPPYLSPAQRFEIMRAVVEKHRPGAPYLSIHVDPKKPEEGFAKIDASLDRMRKEDLLAHVPENVLSAATWLCDNDMTAARALLAASEGKENETLRANAIREIELLKRTIRTGQVQWASYSVRMPAGNLSVSVHKRRAVSLPQSVSARRRRRQKPSGVGATGRSSNRKQAEGLLPGITAMVPRWPGSPKLRRRLAGGPLVSASLSRALGAPRGRTVGPWGSGLWNNAGLKERKTRLHGSRIEPAGRLWQPARPKGKRQ